MTMRGEAQKAGQRLGELEGIGVLRVARREWRLVLVVVVLAFLGLSLRLGTIDPTNEALVKLQITAPQQEDVSLYERARSTTVRDEVTIARNNFSEILQSSEIRRRTVKQLGLQGSDAEYGLDVRMARDSDFTYVTVRATGDELAEKIANAHVGMAIAYYGEVRSRPAGAARAFLEQELLNSERKMRLAEESLSDFRVTNKIGVLESELSSYQSLIQQVTWERNRRILEGLSTKETDALLERLSAERERLVVLAPKYDVLDETVKQARSEYQLVLNKYTEARLKGDNIETVGFIQIVEPAFVRAGSNPLKVGSLLLSVTGALGAGVLAVVVLQLLGRGVARRPVANLQRTAGVRE